MSESIETAIETTSQEVMVSIPPAAAAAVITLAAYGAQDLTRKAVGKVKQIRANRKASKALKQDHEPRRSQA